MRVYTVLLIAGNKIMMPHASEDLAHEFAQRVWRKEKRPFVLNVYRKRTFRGDTEPTNELLSVWNKER